MIDIQFLQVFVCRDVDSSVHIGLPQVYILIFYPCRLITLGFLEISARTEPYYSLTSFIIVHITSQCLLAQEVTLLKFNSYKLYLHFQVATTSHLSYSITQLTRGKCAKLSQLRRSILLDPSHQSLLNFSNSLDNNNSLLYNCKTFLVFSLWYCEFRILWGKSQGMSYKYNENCLI